MFKVKIRKKKKNWHFIVILQFLLQTWGKGEREGKIGKWDANSQKNPLKEETTEK